MDLKKYIRSIPDYPKKGILFRDITTLIKQTDAFNFSIDKIVEISKKIKFDKVAAIESRGFVFASVVSYKLKKPLIMMRKKNKLPSERYSVDFIDSNFCNCHFRSGLGYLHRPLDPDRVQLDLNQGLDLSLIHI